MAEITLSFGSQFATVASEGASLRRYYIKESDGTENDIVWGYAGTANKKGGQGDVLIPFPGRIRDGRYRWKGTEHQLAINDKAGPNAIHGFVRGKLWETQRISERSVRFVTRLGGTEPAPQGYPFELEISVEYTLGKDGLTCAFLIRNSGRQPAPAAAGFHPYFLAGTEKIDDAVAVIPASSYLEFDSNLLPTGRMLQVDGTPVDFRRPKKIGGIELNHCVANLIRDSDGIARARLMNINKGREVVVWMDRAFDYIVLYTGDAIPAPDARRALAIEPMTAGSDAFNHPEWGLVDLQPGQTLRGRYGVSLAGT